MRLLLRSASIRTAAGRPRHRCLAAVVALAAVPLVAACGGSTVTTAAAGGGGGTSGTLKVGVSAGFTTLDPLPFGAKNFFLWGSVYDTAITMHGTTPEPSLVQSWKMARGDGALTLTLRRGVTYTDGTPFNAAALVWNINWQKQPATGSHGLGLWTLVTAKAVNATTVKLTFPHPIPAILGMLAQSPIVKPGAPTSGVGTGPFKVASFHPGTSLTVVRNPHYWQAGLPHADRVTFTNYAQPATAALALKSGTIDMLMPVPDSLVSGLKSAGDTIVNPPASGFDSILVNTSKPPLNDVRVRQALSLAFNRSNFAQTSLFGLNQALYSVFPPGSSVYTSSLNTGSFDPAKAKALLQQAGVRHLALTIDSPTILPQNEFLPVYQQDLAKIGVTLKINQIDPATWAQEAATGAFSQLLSQGSAGGDYDPATFLGTPKLRPAENSEHFSSPEYTKLIATANTETDPAKRTADYQAISRYLQQQAFDIPLATFTWITAYGSRVSGVEPGFTNIPIWSRISVGG